MCPCCGYCPSCGRGGHQFGLRQWWGQPQPYYFGMGGTWHGGQWQGMGMSTGSVGSGQSDTTLAASQNWQGIQGQ